MEMTPEFYIDTISKSPFYKTPPDSFWKVIKETLEEVSRRFPDRPRLIQAEAINKLIVAHCIIPPDQFNERFAHYKKIALRFRRDPSTLWRTIAIGVLSPGLERTYLKSISLPFADEHQTNPTAPPVSQKIGPELITAPKKKHLSKRGELWKLDRRWDNLWPSSRKIFDELLSRATYGKRSPRFPWAYGGLESLEKKTEYEEKQIRRALHHLQGLSMIKRIFRAYKGQGASKYWVFFTPKMSGAFYRLTIPPKKRRS